jgi:CRISPR/Cas system-associated exonuclease Cas4 (RecB family)
MTINISATLLKDHLECPKRTDFRLNHPELIGVPTPDMLVGTYVHTAVEKYWNNKDAAIQYIDKKLLSLPQEYWSKALKSLSSFFDNFQWLCTPEDKTEVSFKLPIENNAFLTGRIDRIVNNSIVIDWKTGREAPKSINTDVQFILYHEAFKRMYNKKPASVFYISLLSNKMVTYFENSSLTGELLSFIIPSVVKNIKENNYPATGLLNGKCFRCAYKDPCWQEKGIQKL